MGRKYCNQLLILLPHTYSTPILTGPSLHFPSPTINTLHLCSNLPPFTALHFTLLHFTSIHCTFRYFTTHSHFLQFTKSITLLTLFLKAFGLQGRSPKISAGNRFQGRTVLFTKEYFLISVLCFLFLIFRSCSILLR